MICRMQACGFDSPTDDPERRFCERCGWPLASGDVSWTPEALNFEGAAPATLAVRVDNETTGVLQWEVRDLPDGVTRVRDGVPARAGQPSTMEAQVDPTCIQSEKFVFTVRTYDKVGGHRNDLRLIEPNEAYQDQRIELNVMRRRKGPLTCDWKALVFGQRATTHSVTLHNEGDTTLHVELRIQGAYLVGTNGIPQQQSLSTDLMPHERRPIIVSRAPGNTKDDGALEITADEQPPLQVNLIAVTVGQPPKPPERYLVAIDFGTSKSAAMVLDQYTKNPAPLPVIWDHQGEKKYWLPSVVAVDETQTPRRFGWEVGDTEEGSNIVRRLKTRLHENSALVNDCVDFYLRRLFAQIDAQFTEQDVFSDCRVVVTLPVLDNGSMYEQQKVLTTELVRRVARDYRVEPESVHTAKEPECAAIDFLAHMQTQMAHAASGSMIQDGEWLCILDMGGGTTDVTFAKLGVNGNGQPSFDQMHSVGFPTAGDYVDETFYAWCLGEWKKRNRLKPIEAKKGVSAENPDDLAKAAQIQLDGEPLALPRSEAIQMVRVLKEAMYRTDTPVAQKLDPFKQINQLTIAPEDVRPRLNAMADRMFVHGDTNYPSVRDALEKTLRLRARDVSLLCITGGTSNIPDFRKSLKGVLNRKDMREMATRDHEDDMRLNVVRGAAQSGVVQVTGRLPFDIRVDLGGQPWRALYSGNAPGIKVKEILHCEAGAQAVIRVEGLMPDKPAITLFSKMLSHDDEDDLSLEVGVEYTPTRQLRLSWGWLRGDKTAECTEMIQTVPHV